jgi:four helix bundle protein
MRDEPIFDHEKLDVYQIELLFIAWVATLLTEVRHAAQGFHREVSDQLDRASLSSLLNTAEGNGKRQGKQRAKFFDDARGSAVECAACLDALAAKELVTTERIAEGKALLLRIVGMLTKLVDRFDAYRAREGEEVDDTHENPPRPSFSFSSLEHVSELEDEGRARERERGGKE